MSLPVGGSDAARLAIACYGKVPVHPEYIRSGLGSEAAMQMVDWVDGAHAALTAARRKAGRSGPPSPSEVLHSLKRFAVLRPKRPALIAGIVARSSDGLREHPVTLFVELDEVSEGALPLLPLVLEPIWTHLSGVLEGPLESREGLIAALERGCPRPSLDPNGDQARAMLETARDAASWPALTRAAGETAVHLAMNLFAVTAAQREARIAEEGVALSVPLGEADGAAERAGVWLKLLAELVREAVGCRFPTFALGLQPSRLFVFLRPAEGNDLAAMLDSLDLAAIDDLSDVWQKLPPDGTPRRAALDRLTETGTDGLAPLVALVSEVAKAWETREA